MSALPSLNPPFSGRQQQRDADTLAMHIFLATEMMLFGGLLLAILACRLLHPQSFIAASSRLDLVIGTANTGLLLTSSLFAALAVPAARDGKFRRCVAMLGAAALLGLGFLVLKGIEYHDDAVQGLLPRSAGMDGVASLFLSLYYISTALHALHVTIGIGLFGWLTLTLGRQLSKRGDAAIRVANVALYWHFVDVVWVFLFPALYLARS